MSTTEYVQRLYQMKADSKAGSLSLLRLHAGQRLDYTLTAFDLFTGLWWPLRQASQFAPRRRVAWLAAKLYAFCPLHLPENDADRELCRQFTLPRQLGNIWRSLANDKKDSFQQRFDHLLTLPLDQIEPALQWALRAIAEHGGQPARLDWVQLIDDLSRWERTDIRQQWAEVFLGEN